MEGFNDSGEEKRDSVEGTDDLDCAIEAVSIKHVLRVKGYSVKVREDAAIKLNSG